MVWFRKVSERKRDIRQRRGVSGRSKEMPIIDLLQILAHGGQNGCLTLRGDRNQVVGEVVISEAKVISAEFQALSRETAVAAILNHPMLYFDFKPYPVDRQLPAIGTVMTVLMDALRIIDERDSMISYVQKEMDVLMACVLEEWPEFHVSPETRQAMTFMVEGSPMKDALPDAFYPEETKILRELKELIRLAGAPREIAMPISTMEGLRAKQ